LASELALILYEKMRLIRTFEERVGELFSQGVLFGTTHPCVGQEGTAAGVTSALEPGDVVTSTHRGHGHFLAFTDNVNGLAAEIMGKQTGVCGGRGGSQHLFSEDFYTNGITGGMAVVGTGMALAESRGKTGRIVCSFIGDGAMGQGAVLEAMNLASLWNAPILYVLENNLYAMSTKVDDALAGELTARADALDIQTEQLETSDVVEIHETAARAARFVRKNSRPLLLELKTYRFCGHSINDECAYRTREEEDEWSRRDPLGALARQIPAADRERLDERCRRRVEHAVAEARRAPVQDPRDIGTGLWQSTR
jgi:TPP-dependent pyruvate/acetoin dehydrogenase alpha subunit